MHRKTKTPAIALDRLREVLGVDPPEHRRTSIRKLAFLADCARRMKRDDVRETVRFTGRAPSRGVKGWEAEAIDWLRLDV